MIRHVVRNKSRGSIRYKTSFANAYDPVSVESGRYEKWEKLNASPYETKSTYSMILPPPNVTGRLHVGHALTLAIQDCFVRFQKMKGKNVTWIPGLDHAGIATQSVVEKQLKKTLNLTRQDMPREEFLEHVWDWTNSNGGHIEKQIKSLGASLDWTRQFFTLDEARSEAVTEAFVRLYDAGLIYRGERMVHWCPHLRTVISDIEIEYEDLTEGPQTLRLPNHQDVEFGYIHHFEYEIQNSSKKIEVATTRLETMLGDVAIAVHPEDPRWCSEIGHFATHPFRPGHRMPIVADETLVDMSTGTGAVKLTPAHDPNDFEAAKRHDLPVRSILDLNARMTEEVGSRYAGHDRFEVQDMLERDLNSLGLYKGKKKHEMRVARCSRSGDVLEPMLLPQWFVRTEDMAKESIRHVMTTGEMKMIPKTLEKEWRRWLEHPQDWCVSRQLVWGHRIPAYRVVGHEDTFVVGRNLEEATTRAREKLDLSEDMELRLEQDDDVLDTWFSSGLLPLSANGWPHRLDNDSYPLDLMETGSDILFFWVARMSMLCTYLDDQNRAPFRNVYCHSLVRDKYGRKMSKSLGNVILPEYVIDGRELKDLLQDLKDGNLSDKELKRSLRETKKEFPNGIEACGTDALRLALLLQGERPHLDASEVLQCRHFCNKLWQASRFTTLLRDRAGDRDELRNKQDHQDLPLLQRWIRSRLAFVSNEVNESLENYDAARAAHAVRSFVQNEYCGVFIEFAKPTQYEETCELAGTCLSASEVASEVLDSALKLLHPFVPYVTEALYEHTTCAVDREDSIVMTSFPQQISMGSRDFSAEQDMTKLLDTLRAIRSVRKRASEIGLTQDSLGKVRVVVNSNDEDEKFLQRYSNALLSQCKGVEVLEFESEELECSLVSSVPSLCRVYLALEKSKDALDRMDQELNRIEKRSRKLQKKHDRVLKSFEKSRASDHVPEHVLETQRKDLSDLEEQLNALTDSKTSVRDVLKVFGSE